MISQLFFRLSNPAKLLIVLACLSFTTIVIIFKNIELKIAKAEDFLHIQQLEIEQLENTKHIGNSR